MQEIDNLYSSWSSVPLKGESLNAWILFHAIMAFGDSAVVSIPPGLGGSTLDSYEVIAAIELATSGRIIDGLGAGTTNNGSIVFDVNPSIRGSQAHQDQWLALALINYKVEGAPLCSLTPESSFAVAANGELRRTTIDALVRESWRRANLNQDFAWSLIAYSAIGKRADGPDGSRRIPALLGIDEIEEIQASRDPRELACGGLHAGIALAIAMQRQESTTVSESSDLGGTHAAHPGARAFVEDMVAFLKHIQRPSGSFLAVENEALSNRSVDSIRLEVDGHSVQFLALALEKHSLGEPWVTRSVQNLIDLLGGYESARLSGAAYHALHGLAVYRNKMIDGK